MSLESHMPTPSRITTKSWSVYAVPSVLWRPFLPITTGRPPPIEGRCTTIGALLISFSLHPARSSSNQRLAPGHHQAPEVGARDIADVPELVDLPMGSEQLKCIVAGSPRCRGELAVCVVYTKAALRQCAGASLSW